MNWTRGLFRLWIALSAVWIAFMSWVKHSETSRIPDPPPGFRIDGGLRDPAFWLDIATPPLVVGILLLVALWIARGFRRSN